METKQASDIIVDNFLDLTKNSKKSTLCLTLRHGESVSVLGGLIEIEIDLEYHPTRPMLRFKAPFFVDIFRVKNKK